jgi:hypothetical protein
VIINTSSIYADRGRDGKPDLNALIDRAGKKILEYVSLYSGKQTDARDATTRRRRPTAPRASTGGRAAPRFHAAGPDRHCRPPDEIPAEAWSP